MPVTDPARIVALQKQLATAFDGDPTVTNPGRVMRLAGSVAHPAKTGRVTELTRIEPLKKPGAASYSAAQLEEAFARAPQETNAAPDATNDDIAPPQQGDGTAEASAKLPNLGLMLSRSDSELQKLLLDSRIQGQWHSSILAATASMIGRGYSDQDIRAQCGGYCTGGSGDPELQQLIDGGRVKFGKPNVEQAGRPARKPGDKYLNIRTAASFASEYTPADYLVDGLLQTAFLYALTAQTGVGKTAWALLLSQCTADGSPFAGREVKAGAVIYCAGENPDELRQRFLAMCDHAGRDAASFNIHFLTPTTSSGLLVGFDEVEAYAKSIGGDVRCVIVDTAAAFFDGDDENSNTELGDYARRLRRLSELPGRPAIIVPCHPVKNPKTREECVPRGGGAFVNEVDGNLILWPTGDDTVEMSWVRKFRGPQFAPVQFRLQQVETKTVVDAKGRPVRSVLARAVGEQEAVAQQGVAQDEQKLMLVALFSEPGATTPTGLALACGWLSNVGTETSKTKELQRGRARRRLKELKGMRLVEQAAIGGAWRLTARGKVEALRLTKGEPSEPI